MTARHSRTAASAHSSRREETCPWTALISGPASPGPSPGWNSRRDSATPSTFRSRRPISSRCRIARASLDCGWRSRAGSSRRPQERARRARSTTQAIEKGHRAAIAEEERPDVFTMRMGNLLPGESGQRAPEPHQPLPFDDGEVDLPLPAGGRAPVYPRPRAARIDGRAGRGRMTPTPCPTPPGSPRRCYFPGSPIRSGSPRLPTSTPRGCRSHGPARACAVQAATRRRSGQAIVRLDPGERLDRDFILRLAVAQPVRSHRRCRLPAMTAGHDQGTFALTLLPPADAASPRPRDMLFVLDRSGQHARMEDGGRAPRGRADCRHAHRRGPVRRACFDNVIESPARPARRVCP